MAQQENTFNPYSVTLEDIYRDASLLMQGQEQASVKLALWIAACSTNQALDKNGKMARVLAPYVHRPLPTRDVLASMLRMCQCFFTGRMLDTIYYIEHLDECGYLRGLEHIPSGFIAQSQWREDVLSLLKGHGMAYKTISFACMLLNPLKCELVPIDRHVIARLDIKGSVTPTRYLAIEQLIVIERHDYHMENVPLCLFHWWLWEAWRQYTGASKFAGSVESHCTLSCYDYPTNKAVA